MNSKANTAAPETRTDAFSTRVIVTLQKLDRDFKAWRDFDNVGKIMAYGMKLFRWCDNRTYGDNIVEMYECHKK